MKLGLVSAILPELSLEEVLEFARCNGFACVEAMCWPIGKAERDLHRPPHADQDTETGTFGDQPDRFARIADTFGRRGRRQRHAHT